MRINLIVFAALLSFGGPAVAQDTTSEPSAPSTQDAQTEEEKRKSAELNVLIERARARQRAADQRSSMLWERWTYAVCLGCGPAPSNVRVVHTHPLRVLSGIPAADDDARERGRRPQT